MTVSRLEVVSFPSNALLWSLSSETTWVGSCVFGCSRVETRDMWMLPRDVTEKALLSSAGVEFVFFAVMPPILRIRLDGWFSRCRGQSSGKSASRQRSYERYSRDVNEPIDVHAKSHAMFESDLRLARCFSTVRLAPPHGRLVESDCPYGAEPRPCPGLLGGPKFCDISCTFGIDKLTDLYTCIIMQGAKI